MDVFLLSAHSCIKIDRKVNGKADFETLKLKDGQHIIYTTGELGTYNLTGNKVIYKYLMSNGGLNVIRRGVLDPQRFIQELNRGKGKSEYSQYKYVGPGSSTVNAEYDIIKDDFTGVFKAPSHELGSEAGQKRIAPRTPGRQVKKLLNTTKVNLRALKLSEVLGNRKGIFIISACRGVYLWSKRFENWVNVARDPRRGPKVSVRRTVPGPTRSGNPRLVTTDVNMNMVAKELNRDGSSTSANTGKAFNNARKKINQNEEVQSSSGPPRRRVVDTVKAWAPMLVGVAIGMLIKKSDPVRKRATNLSTQNDKKKWLARQMKNMSPKNRQTLYNNATRQVRRLKSRTTPGSGVKRKRPNIKRRYN